MLSFLRKIPKKELEGAAKARNTTLSRAAKTWPYAHLYEHRLACWLEGGNRSLNKWMVELYRHKYPGEEVNWSWFSLILDEEDILLLKMEMVFGFLTDQNNEGPGCYPSSWVLPKNTDFTTNNCVKFVLDKALRIIRNNRSYVYYGSF